jgi:hypothetical protein
VFQNASVVPSYTPVGPDDAPRGTKSTNLGLLRPKRLVTAVLISFASLAFIACAAGLDQQNTELLKDPQLVELTSHSVDPDAHYREFLSRVKRRAGYPENGPEPEAELIPIAGRSGESGEVAERRTPRFYAGDFGNIFSYSHQRKRHNRSVNLRISCSCIEIKKTF